MNYDEPEVLSPVVTRVLANNPTIMTGPGTNTYVVGTGPVAVIDAGPDDETHLTAVEAAVAGREVVAVLCTHHHSDHAPGSVPLARALAAPVAARVHEKGPAVDIHLEDGDVLEVAGARLRAFFTPGHASDHLCFEMLSPARALFSGDHIMSGSTVVIAPPDGHMATYLDSLRRVLERRVGRIYPGHGPVIGRGRAVVEEYIRHRNERREQVAGRLRAGDRTVAEIVATVYAGVPEVLHPVARFSVQAHLHELADGGRAVCDALDLEARWKPTGTRGRNRNTPAPPSRRRRSFRTDRDLWKVRRMRPAGGRTRAVGGGGKRRLTDLPGAPSLSGNDGANKGFIRPATNFPGRRLVG